MFKTDKKTRNYIISFPRDKMHNGSRKKSVKMRTSVVINFGDQMETKFNKTSVLVL